MDSKLISILKDDANVRAFYQPILALDTHQIMGYEVLGRIKSGSKFKSLGPFFTNPSISLNEQLRVDLLIRNHAFSYFVQNPSANKLFVNIKPSWMFRSYQESGDMFTLRLLERYGIPPSSIVIEVTEDDFRGSIEELQSFVEKYREKGCLIAIDDIGTGSSNIDRIVRIKPNFLKADIYMMKKSAYDFGYLGALRSISMLADQIGAALLIEGVETREDLRRAISIGAHYVQGFLFSQVKSRFQSEDKYAALIKKEINTYREQVITEERLWWQMCRMLIDRLQLQELASFEVDAINENDDVMQLRPEDRFIDQRLTHMNECCLRVYICSASGEQRSSNFVRNANNHWIRKPEFQGINWSWRPNFIAGLLAGEGQRKVVLSDSYSDLDSKKIIRTLFVTLEHGIIFLIDIDVISARAVFPSLDSMEVTNSTE
ncbi:MAG: EAL domain-containing protein [Sporolactobacillus sp.]